MKIDNFALTAFQTCPAKYALRIRQGWIPVRRKAALGFGGAIHAGLAEWYKTGSRAAALAKINEMWPDNMPVDDYRTKEKALTVLAEYLVNYPTEQFAVIGAPQIPLIEKAFTLSTGLYLPLCRECSFDSRTCVIDYSPKDTKCRKCDAPLELIEYGGILDGGIEFFGSVYALEHKTTSMMGAGYFNQFKPNNQVTGYIWALGQLTGKPVGGAIINAIGFFKASKTRFERQPTSRSPDEIAEWLLNVHAICSQIQQADMLGYWPMATGACTLYGLCDYHNVHVLATETERNKRLETDYVREPWDYEERDG